MCRIAGNLLKYAKMSLHPMAKWVQFQVMNFKTYILLCTATIFCHEMDGTPNQISLGAPNRLDPALRPLHLGEI